MDRCYDCENWEEKYDNLYRRFDKLSNQYDDLEKKYSKTEDKLNSANWTIERELEPRLQNERRSYDDYVTSGGSDECFSNGMSGRCGFECSAFGSKEECYDGMTKEEDVIHAYEEYGDTEYLSEIIDRMGLREKINESDRKYYQEEIDKHKEIIHKLEESLKEI